ncbi:MAG: hypothetical protein KJI69_05465 [Patescibacteria group bacterium]|nr:hypothetical protein [Patescibacteria group bacterium]
MIPSLMNEGNRGTKTINQTTEILVWWKKLGNGKLEKANNDLEKLKIKSQIYDKILVELPHVKRATIRRAVNTHLGWTPKPKKVEVSA